MAKNVRVGFLQYQPKMLAVEENVMDIVKMLRPVSEALVVLPELATAGYCFANRKEALKVAEPADQYKSPTLAAIAKTARKQRLNVVIGFAERSGGQVFNSAALVAPEGITAVYRKIHLFKREKLFFAAGNAPPPVIRVKGLGRVGLMICYDWYFPEAARSLAFRGADIIAHPANLVLPWCLDAMKTRSIENKVFSITANRTGLEKHGGQKIDFYGRSQVVSPDGNLLLKVGKRATGVFTVHVDIKAARDKSISKYNPGMNEVRRELLPLQ